jgi:hypothetical protein
LRSIYFFDVLLFYIFSAKDDLSCTPSSIFFGSDLTLPDSGRGVTAVGVLCVVAGVVVASSKLLVHHRSTVNHYFKQIVNFLCLLLLYSV